MRSKSGLQTEILQLRADLEKRDGELQQLRDENQRMAGQISEYQATEKRLADALKVSEEQAHDANTAAADMLRAKGVEPSTLPAATSEAQETVEQLNDKLSSESDPKERFRLTQRIIALQKKSN
jgi:predicted RNase H-like nuclease (RuvC/YqgF family)